MQFGVAVITLAFMKQNAGDRPLPRTRSKRVITLSTIASIILHPLLMTTLMALILRGVETGERPGKNWVASIVLCTIVLPFLAIVLFRITGVISDVKMDKPRDRILPLVATLIFYLLAYKIFAPRYDEASLIRSLLLGGCFAIAIVLVINFFYKVSVHTTAAAILPGMSLLMEISQRHVYLLFPVAVVIALLVGVVRWLLGAHTPGQILLGYAVGIFSQISAYFLLTNNTFLARILLVS
jgi:hypothetical protein